MATNPDLPSLKTLPDPVEWPQLPGERRRLALVIAGSILLGLASAALIAWTVGDLQIAYFYGALILGAAAVAYSATSVRTRRSDETVDWMMIRTVLDACDDALAITDGSDRLICANEAYGERCGGYPSPLMLAGSGPQARAVIENIALQARRDGNGYAEIILSVEDREPQHLQVSCEPADTAGTHLLWRLSSTSSDKLLSETISLVEGGFGAWASAADIMMVLTDRQGMILASNKAFRTAIDVPIVTTNLSDVLMIVEGEPKKLQRREGTLQSVRITELALPDARDGMPNAYLFLLLDDPGPATSVRGGLDSVPALLDTLPLGLALADRDGRLTFMNDAFAAAAGIQDHSEVLYPSDLVVDDDKTIVSDTVRRAASGYAKSRDLRVHLKHGPEDQVVLTIARAPELGQAGVVLSLKDNSEQLKLERQVTQATKMQAVGQLAGGVAHDFNNILTAVIGYCDLMLLRHTPGDADYDDIDQIRQNANRAANLVRQLLAFSRQQTLRPQLLQISDVVGELSHLLKRLLGETITLHVRHGRDLGLVRADPGQLEQVIVNLAVNARDAMPKGGELTISTHAVTPSDVRALGHEMMPPADYVAISVADTGIGIPPEIIGKIFEPFFTTKEVGKGTGLGLSTVYGIVKQTGGFIFADSVPDKGTVFTIYLPLQMAESETETPKRMLETEIGDTWGQGTILLVEDEGMVRAVAERALTRKGYDVLTAANGEEALEILDGRPEGVDLLISDVVMPTMDGPTLVGHARARFPDLRIIFMSGYAEEQLRRSIDVPGIAFLPKPFSVQQLGEAVRTALARETASLQVHLEDQNTER